MLEKSGAIESPKNENPSGAAAPSHEPKSVEPQLALENIQGNLIGFNKDHQNFLFFKIEEIEIFRRSFENLIPFIATAQEVFVFNRLFKTIKERRGKETQTVRSTWFNIAFSYPALQRLIGSPAALRTRALQSNRTELHRFRDSSDSEEFGVDSFEETPFEEGMAVRAVTELGDPPKKTDRGNPAKWVFGGPGKEVDVVIIVASDTPRDLREETKRIEEALGGVKRVFRQKCAALEGKEHFGFRDGVSQPRLRGLPLDGSKKGKSRGGGSNASLSESSERDLLWPGEFIIGYEEQSAIRGATSPGGRILATNAPGGVNQKVPNWAADGSFLVIRRLRQDVAAFHQFLKKSSEENMPLTPDLIGAKIIGRNQDGSPIVHGFDASNKPVDSSRPSNHDFGFASDPDGRGCPFAAHIRKVNPRDDQGGRTNEINQVTTRKHRMIRRGIPYGVPYSPEDGEDSRDRGLMFVAYMSSIRRQFEFIQKQWANNANFLIPAESGDRPRSGYDLIIGQNMKGSRMRQFVIPSETEGGKPIILETDKEWVTATGGGYFFAPSISALRLFAEGDLR